MRQSTKRLTSSALGLLLILGSFVLFLNFIQPAYDAAQELRAEEARLGAMVAEERRITEQIQNLLATYENEEAARRGLSLALPIEPDVADALGQLNGLALLNGIIPQSFSVIKESTPVRNPRAQKPTSTVVLLPAEPTTIKMAATGTYEDIERFLVHVETNIRILDVKTLSIQPDGTSPDRYKIELAVAAYHQQEKQP